MLVLKLREEKVDLAYVEEIKVLKGGWTRRQGIRGRVRGHGRWDASIEATVTPNII